MAKQWDTLIKLLVEANRQDLVSLLIPGAKYKNELNTEMQSRTLEADLLYIIIWSGQQIILHVEFQKRRDGKMDRRLWEYNAQVAIITGLPVCSFVIYLKRDGNVVLPPYELKLPDGKVVHRFSFNTVKLWEIPGALIKEIGLEGLLPLLPLMKDGVHREVVEDMIVSLDIAGKSDLLSLAYAFAGLVFKKAEDRDWLRKRFAMLQDDILEDSWSYQEMLAKGLQKGLKTGLEKGLEQGLEKGLEQGLEKGLKQGLEKGLEQGLEKGLKQGLEKGRHEGEIQALREAIMDVVQERFSQIVVLAHDHIQTINDPVQLRRLIVKLSAAQTVLEVEQALSSNTQNGQKH